MANEVTYEGDATGLTLKFTVRSVSGQILDVASGSFVARVVANWANYINSMTESPAGSYLYFGDLVNGGWGPQWVHIVIRDGSLISSTILADQFLYWDGSKLTPSKAAASTFVI